jgi:N-acetylneuraminate synthase
LVEEDEDMGKFDAVEVLGTGRDEILTSIRKQMTAWGLTMPPVTPLPLHFGLHQFMETGETEFWVANEAEHGYCGKFLFVFDGQTCPYHYHRMKHETFFILKGSLRMKVGEEERIMHEGDLLAMPPGVGHSFTGVGPALILEVSMPSILQDNFFADKRIGQDGVI